MKSNTHKFKRDKKTKLILIKLYFIFEGLIATFSLRETCDLIVKTFTMHAGQKGGWG